MQDQPRCFALNISEHLFRLTTEGIRLLSNDTERHETLAALVRDRIERQSEIEDHAPEIIREHLVTVPTEGHIRVDIEITASSADTLDRVKAHFSNTLETDVSVGDTLSIMLFHYVAARKTETVLQNLGLASLDQLGRQSEDDGIATKNVFPIR